MDDFTALKFVNNSAPIRSIQGITREEGRNRRRNGEEKQQPKKQEDTLELNQAAPQVFESTNTNQPNTSQPATGLEGIPGEHVDVRI